ASSPQMPQSSIARRQVTARRSSCVDCGGEEFNLVALEFLVAKFPTQADKSDRLLSASHTHDWRRAELLHRQLLAVRQMARRSKRDTSRRQARSVPGTAKAR